MDVKLKVTNGRHTGREIAVKGPKFFIGRAEDCHLRPASDQVSRHHCVILVAADAVSIRDLGSRNGTFVNGKQISPQCRLRSGDRVVVGQLDFDIQIVGMPPEPAEPQASPAAAVETSASPSAVAKPSSNGKKRPVRKKDAGSVDDELDLSQWFGDEAGSSKTDTRTVDVSAVVQEVRGNPGVHIPPKDPEPEVEANAPKRDVSEAEKEKARRAQGGPTTQDAAAEMLKKLMGARR